MIYFKEYNQIDNISYHVKLLYIVKHVSIFYVSRVHGCHVNTQQ